MSETETRGAALIYAPGLYLVLLTGHVHGGQCRGRRDCDEIHAHERCFDALFTEHSAGLRKKMLSGVYPYANGQKAGRTTAALSLSFLSHQSSTGLNSVNCGL